MTDLLAMLFLGLGGIFLLTGSLGVLRFEDVYLRLQAASKSLTFGLGFFLLGAALLTPGAEVGWKVALAILFQFLTAPISAFLIARVAMRKGIRPVKLEEAGAKSSGRAPAAESGAMKLD